MTDDPDNFTPDSLQNFLRHGPARKYEAPPNPGEPTPEEARTARARRIEQILRDTGKGGGDRMNPETLDASIRQGLAELVRSMMQRGMYAELNALLASHQRFITEIQNLLKNAPGA